MGNCFGLNSNNEDDDDVSLLQDIMEDRQLSYWPQTQSSTVSHNQLFV